tara:strand:- start:2058 stop:3305 length:1248 start_codon:yes stop_codon:yes gene_type:complete
MSARRDRVKQWLIQENNNFCALPYTHVAIEANGDLLPCCMGKTLTDEKENKINLKNNTLETIIKSKARKKMVESFNKNLQFSNCNACWQNKSIHSPRVNYSTNPETIEFTEKAMRGELLFPKLTWLEIKPGNRCNLKCRICGTHNSSSWADDVYNIWYENKNIKETSLYRYMQDCNWITDPHKWKFGDSLNDIKTIHIMGGEPFMVPEHLTFLKNLTEKIDTSKVKLWYNTNGTFPITKKYLDIMKKFEYIVIGCSIDDIGLRMEYQRKNANWTNVVNNINQFYDIQRKNNNFNIIIDLTTSIFNVYYIDEIYDAMLNKKWVFPSNHHHYVDHHDSPYNIRTLNFSQKQKIKDKLFKSKLQSTNLIKNIINFMEKDLWTEEIEKLRRTNIIKLDKIRHEKFNTIFPEMAEILEWN